MAAQIFSFFSLCKDADESADIVRTRWNKGSVILNWWGVFVVLYLVKKHEDTEKYLKMRHCQCYFFYLLSYNKRLLLVSLLRLLFDHCSAPGHGAWSQLWESVAQGFCEKTLFPLLLLLPQCSRWAISVWSRPDQHVKSPEITHLWDIAQCKWYRIELDWVSPSSERP